ncbi:DUF2726 domain-containing protein [Neptuniibacter sp. QD57_21]|uniref:DUF2726 domain-containing protein n=1 Tax=Neptuniibacter sp. QD57_21 TaxID=3398213 RepID=UPI0039F46414
MEWILIFAVLMFVALIFLKKLAAQSSDSSDNTLGYRQKKTLFTEAERSFLGVLDQCIDPQQHRIFGKVRVADIVEPNPTKNRSEWSRAFGKIKAKHFDYLICTADTLKPVCAIELDDKSHSQKKRQQRDQLLESVCSDANLPLIRVPAKRSYKLEEVKAVLSKRFAQTQTGSAVGQDVASQLEKKINTESVKTLDVINTKGTDIAVGKVNEEVKVL